MKGQKKSRLLCELIKGEKEFLEWKRSIFTMIAMNFPSISISIVKDLLRKLRKSFKGKYITRILKNV
jgi:hypothetical protein